MNRYPLPLDWFRPALGEEEEELILDVVRSGFVNDGPMTRRFEQRVAEMVGVRHCVAVTSGTAAITLALMGVGVEPGDEVIVPDLTFIATANAARLAGACVKLVDIEPNRFGLDVDRVAEAIGPKTKAIVPVDVNGRAPDYGRLEALARSRGLRIVCDAAEGLGSSFLGRALGSFGDAGCLSFSPNKLVTTGQGGMIATDDTTLYHRLLELKDQGRCKRGTGGDDLHPVLGFNFKFTDLQAAVGLAQLDRLAERCRRAVERDGWYRRLLADIPGLEFPDPHGPQPGEVHGWTDVLVSARDRVRRGLDEAGIGHRAFWFALHTQEPYQDRTENFPLARRVSERGLWLPSAFDISEADVERVADVFKNIQIV